MTWTILHSYHQHESLVFPLLPLHLVLPVFFMLAVLGDDTLCLIVVLSCLSLMINNVGHFFISWLAIFTFSLEKYLLKSFVQFLTGLSFHWVVLPLFLNELFKVFVLKEVARSQVFSMMNYDKLNTPGPVWIDHETEYCLYSINLPHDPSQPPPPTPSLFLQINYYSDI